METLSDYRDLQNRAIAQISYYVELAFNKLNIKMRMPDVKFSLKGMMAGRAWYGRHLIELNPVLLRQNPEDMLKDTTGHEVAHLAAFLKYGVAIKPHGKEWSATMWNFGLPAKRCHNYGSQNQKVIPIIKEDGATVTMFASGRVIDFDS